MAWKPKYRRQRKSCVVCGQMFECYRVSQKACSRRCAGKRRAGHMVALANKGGQAVRARKMAADIAILRAAGLVGAQLDAALAHGKRTYQRGHSAGTRAGVRLGWAEALGERKAS